MSEPLLKIENLEVDYKTDAAVIHAVNGINLEVNRQQTLGLVGETGAGKTTTALSILRLLPQKTGIIRAGSILFDGQDLVKLSEEEMRRIRGQKISMIFQDPMTSLNPIMTVGDQIRESLENHNIDGIHKAEMEKRVDELLELVGIPARRKHEYPHQFSGGMKQRVVIAIALACSPALLIADEPTTALDVTIQAQVLALMRDLEKRLGTATILITHDLGVVAEICDSVAIMYAGEIVEKGTLEDVFAGEKHHPYTRGLFGSIPNIHEKSRRLHPIDGLMPDPADLPAGCKFHNRCSFCMDCCRTVQPPVFREGTHEIQCHLFHE